MTTRITINVTEKYDVLIGEGLLGSAGAELAKIYSPCRAAVVTDSNVDGLYSEAVMASLSASGFEPVKYVFPAGEKSKNLETFGKLLDFFAESGLTRSDIVVALGGGVVGDMTGFAAASYMRGVPFVQLPTSLLAMVDSSVGGKTAIDLPAGKNLAGAFKQPLLVLCDTDVLKTLPEREFSEGAAEIIKYGVIADKELLELVTENGVHENTGRIIARCVELKSEFISGDERDFGSRRLLNFGHTPAHAIEKLSGYETSHGQAVAIGMCIMSRAAFNLGLSTEDCFYPIYMAIEKCGLPSDCVFSAQAVAEIALSDKKRSGDTIALVVPERVGKCFIHEISRDELYDFIAEGV